MLKQSLNITILFGSYRSTRMGIRAVKYIQAALKAAGNHPTVVDAKEIGLPLLDRRYQDYEPGKAPDMLEKLASLYHSTDAYVVVAGEYNHGIQPGLKNLFDYFLEEYAFRPSGIVCYSTGESAGIRAAMQLRVILGYLNMPTLSSILAIPTIHETLTPEGKDTTGKLANLTNRFIKELNWYGCALKNERLKGLP